MKGVKAVYETLVSGPVKVRVLAVFSTYNDLPLEVVAQVTSRTNRTWPCGYLTVIPLTYLWEKHRYLGKARSVWEGRPDLSGLPRADATLLKALAEQNRYR